MTTLPARKSYPKEALDTLWLAGPVMLGHLGHMITQQADTLMIGQLGKDHLAAASLANSIFFLPVVVGLGICMALAPLVAQGLGAQREDEVRALFGQGIWVSIWSGLLLIGMTFGLAELIPYLKVEPAVVPLAQEYMRILGVSALPLVFFQALKHYADGFEDVLPGMLAMGLIVLVNIGVNWLLIFGNWGFPQLDLNGAGWATLIARCVGGFALLGYLYLAPRYKRYRRDFGWAHDWRTIKRILKIGLPSGLQYLFEVGSFTGAVIMIGPLGSAVLSAHHIALGIPAIVYMAYMGISAAGSIRVGNALGRGDLLGVKRAGGAAFLACLPFIFFGVLFMVVLNEWIPTLYIDDAEVREITARLLLIAALFQVADGIQAVFLGVLRGMEDVRVPTILTFIAYWVIGLPVGYWLMETAGWGVDGMWFGLTAGLAFSAVFLSVRFLQLMKRSSV